MNAGSLFFLSVPTLLLTCKFTQVTSVITMHVGLAGVDRRQLDHGLGTASQDRPGGETPHRARLCPPGDKETREEVHLQCLGLGFRVYRTIVRMGLGCGGRAKGPFLLGVGRLILGQLLPTHSLQTPALGPPSCWKGAAGLWRKEPMGSDDSCM